jgi:hypothetical protein
MTKKIKSVVYGEGGYNETMPDNNVIETVYYTEDELVEVEAIEAKVAERQALLERLGITQEEAQLLLGGNK